MVLPDFQKSMFQVELSVFLNHAWQDIKQSLDISCCGWLTKRNP
jgi:hypothetical protein